MPITGQDVVVNNIIKIGGRFLTTVNEVMREVAYVLDTEITKNIGIVDEHTIKELAKMGHPYSKNNADIKLFLNTLKNKYGTSKSIEKRLSEIPENPHDPYYLIHNQGGGLLGGKTSGTIPASMSGGTLKASAFVKIDGESVPYAKWVFYGTSKMVPRPALEASKENVAPLALTLIRQQLKNVTLS